MELGKPWCFISSPPVHLPQWPHLLIFFLRPFAFLSAQCRMLLAPWLSQHRAPLHLTHPRPCSICTPSDFVNIASLSPHLYFPPFPQISLTFTITCCSQLHWDEKTKPSMPTLKPYPWLAQLPVQSSWPAFLQPRLHFLVCSLFAPPHSRVFRASGLSWLGSTIYQCHLIVTSQRHPFLDTPTSTPVQETILLHILWQHILLFSGAYHKCS